MLAVNDLLHTKLKPEPTKTEVDQRLCDNFAKLL